MKPAEGQTNAVIFQYQKKKKKGNANPDRRPRLSPSGNAKYAQYAESKTTTTKRHITHVPVPYRLASICSVHPSLEKKKKRSKPNAEKKSVIDRAG